MKIKNLVQQSLKKSTYKNKKNLNLKPLFLKKKRRSLQIKNISFFNNLATSYIIDSKHYNALKKKIWLNNRGLFFAKKKKIWGVKIRTKRSASLRVNKFLNTLKIKDINMLVRIQNGLLPKKLNTRVFKSKLFLKNNKKKKIKLFWKGAKIFVYANEGVKSVFFKKRVLKVFLKNTELNSVKRIKKNKKLRTKLAYKDLKKKYKNFYIKLQKVNKKGVEHQNFLSTFYGSVLFNISITKPVNPAYYKYVKNFNILRFFRKSFRSEVLTQLSKKDTRFVADSFKYKNMFKTLGEDWFFRKINPWFNSLVYKRDLYRGSVQSFNRFTKKKNITWKSYLRYKNPRREKRNKIYNRYLYLLPSQKNSTIQINKKNYIKKTISKLLLPFYGNLTEKQFKKIVKKTRKVKSTLQSRQDRFLSKFERRLDVVVFRLNLAPNILWARRMIQSGNVFVTNRDDIKPFFSFQGLKKNSFPLKLRDPKVLYKKNGFKYFGKQFKNFLSPLTNPSYLINTGDLVQCSSIASVQSIFKTNEYLFKKPIPKHFLTVKSGTIRWNRYYTSYVPKNIWEQKFYKTTAAVMLFDPTTSDVHYKDRSNESFLKWVIL